MIMSYIQYCFFKKNKIIIMIFKSNLVIVIGKIVQGICVYVFNMFILRYHLILLIMISRLDLKIIIIFINIILIFKYLII